MYSCVEEELGDTSTNVAQMMMSHYAGLLLPWQHGKQGIGLVGFSRSDWAGFTLVGFNILVRGTANDLTIG